MGSLPFLGKLAACLCAQKCPAAVFIYLTTDGVLLFSLLICLSSDNLVVLLLFMIALLGCLVMMSAGELTSHTYVIKDVFLFSEFCF